MEKQKIKFKEHELVERERSDECLSLVPTNGASLKRWQWPHEHMRAAAGARRWGQCQGLGKRVREGGEGGRVEGAYRREGWPPPFSLGSSHVKEVGTVFLVFFLREVKERNTLAVDSRGEPIDLNVFLWSRMTVLFFFFPSPPDPFMRIHFFFKRARKEAVFFCFFPPIFFLPFLREGKILKLDSCCPLINFIK